MATTTPTTKLDTRFSMDDATAVPWPDARKQLEDAGVYWLSTVRADGRPHVATLLGVWRDDAFYFCTGRTEQKYKNLEQNSHCAVTTGTNAYEDGLDIVVEGDAIKVTDETLLERLADAWESKYGSDWHFDVRDGAFAHEAGPADVFEVAPVKALGFAKGDNTGQTSWRF